MSQKLVFLSHIHEEKDLAVLIKNAIEDEFSGFVDVFVSSDGESIPAGTNFLKRIENGLVNCCGAIYLISPASVTRSWINFELGAVWVRSCMSERDIGDEIPALPFCHSGMNYNMLPQPISNLNAIEIRDASKLEFAFKSIQKAVGAKGRLSTNFDELASKVITFENNYTIWEKIKKINSFLNGQFSLDNARPLGNGEYRIELGVIPKEKYQHLQTLIPEPLLNELRVSMYSTALWEQGPDSFIGGRCDITLTAKAVKAVGQALH